MDDAKAVKELIVLGRGEPEKIGHRRVVGDRFLNGRPVADARPQRGIAAGSGHVLLFEPSAAEVHRQAGTWFDDMDIYE
jgi:hypothetical protein